ncbi:hypothetical protein VOLCADRAFT_88908 [Volvox carteri f. nagariensis]|uniref:Cyclic nucleotide-binding domain-containing protein n=1 Tax=Volvox carteri f. nagariensis TaxID=3068 RepID=D8TQA0_VOLCA|nr:uncharacterized protein VOLCADRAFT_88908 [Volvox carteri f. nagariensis]EFJ50497.1 hypothetical protein VOLCADRAFT_88908 [Volvox carteri f. nagariensis]|eukprot:XP_002948622.1 hypothetical protein VOLCADRAFT_88908 [Volvox carteri f. nagariensis]
MDAALPVMLPTDSVRIGWSIWTLLLMLYTAVAVPLMIAFHSFRRVIFAHVMGIITFASFRTAYMTERGEVVRTPRLIAVQYTTRGMFFADFLSALPVEVVLGFTHTGSATTNLYWLSILKLPRLFLLMRHLTILTPVRYENLASVARLVLIMLLVTHWAACLWYYLYIQVPGRPWMFNVHCISWTEWERYQHAFYKSFLMILGDRPDTYNNVERIFSIALLSMGACIYAVVVSSMTLLVGNMWGMASRHKQRAIMLQDALRYTGARANDSVRAKVQAYFSHMVQHDHPGPEGVNFLSELPAALHAEVLSSVFEPLLTRVQLFTVCEQPFIWRLARQLRLILFMPRAVIYEEGSVGHEMFVIWRGAVALVGPSDGCMTALLTDGDHFGELGVMTSNLPRPHMAVALRPTDVMVLSKSDLHQQQQQRDQIRLACLITSLSTQPKHARHIMAGAASCGGPLCESTEPGLTQPSTSSEGSIGGRRRSWRWSDSSVDSLFSAMFANRHGSCGAEPQPAASDDRMSAVRPSVPYVMPYKRQPSASTHYLSPVEPPALSRAAVGPVASAATVTSAAVTPLSNSKNSQRRSATGFGNKQRRSATGFERSATGLSTKSQQKSTGGFAGNRTGDLSVHSSRPLISSPLPNSVASAVAAISKKLHSPQLNPHSHSNSRSPLALPYHSRLRRGLQEALSAMDCDDDVSGNGGSGGAIGRFITSAQEGPLDPNADRAPALDGRRVAGGRRSSTCSLTSGGDAFAPHPLLVLAPQPFIGLDPALVERDDSAKMAPLNRTGSRHRARVPLEASATDEEEDAEEACVPAAARKNHSWSPTVANRRGGLPACRNSASHIGAISSCGRVPSDTGFFSRERVIQQQGWVEDRTGNFGSSSGGGGGGSGGGGDIRVAVLEQQLAAVRQQLEESQAHSAMIMENPLMFPAIRAAMQKEIDSMVAQLRSQTDATLQRVLDMLKGLANRTEEVCQQAVVLEDRVRWLEGEWDGLQPPHDTVAATVGMSIGMDRVSMSGRSGTLLLGSVPAGREGRSSDGRSGTIGNAASSSLAPAGKTQGVPSGQQQLGLLLPLSMLTASTESISGRSVYADGSSASKRSLIASHNQLSNRQRHAASVAAYDFQMPDESRGEPPDLLLPPPPLRTGESAASAAALGAAAAPPPQPPQPPPQPPLLGGCKLRLQHVPGLAGRIEDSLWLASQGGRSNGCRA